MKTIVSDNCLDIILENVRNELYEATDKHGQMSSHHEAYGIIMGEVCEYFDEVRKKNIESELARHELIQIAAMAVRAIHDLTNTN